MPASGREEYLAKAKQAEAKAASFADSFYKQSWLNIAADYRQLAEQAGRRPQKEKHS